MPDLDLARLGADLDLMRSGHGPRRQKLRQLLAAVDPRLRRERNIARLRLAHIKFQLRTQDTRAGDPAPLLEAAKQSAARLAALDMQIVREIARLSGSK